jgi:hypothetical protein
MKKIVLLMLLAIISLLFINCDDDRRTYYKATGVGYVFNKKTKEPVPSAQICVSSGFGGSGWATYPAIQEYFPVDNNGYFRIKFIKRAKRENIIYSTVTARAGTSSSSNFRNISLDDLRNIKGIIQVDTMWLTIDY